MQVCVYVRVCLLIQLVDTQAEMSSDRQRAVENLTMDYSRFGSCKRDSESVRERGRVLRIHTHRLLFGFSHCVSLGVLLE